MVKLLSGVDLCHINVSSKDLGFTDDLEGVALVHRGSDGFTFDTQKLGNPCSSNITYHHGNGKQLMH